jgi:hypothetical protein
MRALNSWYGYWSTIQKYLRKRKLWDVTTVDQNKPADYWDIEEVRRRI